MNLEEIKKEFHKLFNVKKEEEKIKSINVEDIVREYLQSLPNCGELISYNELSILSKDEDNLNSHDMFCLYARRNTRHINHFTLYDCAPVNIYEGTNEPYFYFTTYRVERLSGDTCGGRKIGDEFTWGLKSTIINQTGDIKFNDLIKE